MDFLNPAAPGAAPQPTALDSFLQNPRIGAALLQTGLNLMVPQWGSGIGQIGSAIGGGAEAAQRQEAEDLKQQEASSKEDLRSAQAGAAEARSNTAAARSDTAAQRLALMQSESDRKRDAANAANVRLYHQMYEKEMAEIARNNITEPKSRQKPILSMEEWANQRGIGHILNTGLSSEDAMGGGSVPPLQRDMTGKSAGRYSAPSGQVGYWDGTHFWPGK